jgi:ribulose-phosphate 3-epimerase
LPVGGPEIPRDLSDGAANRVTVHLSASMMCARFDNMGAEIRHLTAAGIDSLHFDMMDGHFVPSLGFGIDAIRALRSRSELPLHGHAMVDCPEAFIDAMAAAGCNMYQFHVEATRFPRRMVTRVHDAGMHCGLVINPATPLDYLADGHGADLVLVMAVEPGFAAQSWIEDTPRRVAEIRKRVPNGVALGVDGHVNSATGLATAKAGANLFVCGTAALFGRGGGYAANLRHLRQALVRGAAALQPAGERNPGA